MSFKFWKFQYPEEPDTSPRGSRKRLLGNLLHRALPLMLSGLAALLAAVPGILAFLLFQQTVPLLSMAGLALAGTMAAPLYAAMTHLIELCLTDEPGYFGPRYRVFLRRSWKRCLPAGALFGFLLAVILLALRLFSFAEQWKLVFFTAAVIDLGLFFAILTAAVSIVAAPDREEDDNRVQLRQILARLAQRPQKAALSAIVQAIYWLLVYLFFPYSGYLLPFFSAWVPAFLGLWLLRM